MLLNSNKVLRWLVVGGTVLAVLCCTPKIATEVSPWAEHDPASVCDYKVAITYRAQFRPGEEGEKDFYNNIIIQIEWLWRHNYKVISLNYEYGFDMTRSLILRYAVIKYEGVKNGTKKKESN